MKRIVKYMDWDIRLWDAFFNTFYDQPLYALLNQKRVYKYLDNYTYILEVPFKKRVKLEQPYSNVIWQCWLQGIEKAPKIVKACMASVQRYSGGRRVILITSDNFLDYIQLPNYIIEKWKKGIITNTHFSDIIRIELLSRYGGLWIDATVYCSNDIPKEMTDIELFCFKESLLDPKVNKASSWWMASDANNEIIIRTRDLLFEYWKKEDHLLEYFLLHICLSKVVDCIPRCKHLWYKVPYINNSNPHVLQSSLTHIYNEREWMHIKGLSNIHKLTYKIKCSNKKSFYHKLIRSELE